MLRNAEDLQLCCGWPEPLKIRVWSTLNYPFTFAYFMMAGLLLLLSSKEALHPASVAGFGLLTIGSNGCLGRLVCGIAYLCHFSKGTLPAALALIMSS